MVVKRVLNLSKCSDEKLLDQRFCDLKLSVKGSLVEKCVHRLYDELANRNIRLKPHVWLSNEWFSPDGIPGIAIPFYLAHPRLKRLEKKMMLEVEGGTMPECMKILRHEAGHTICSAYRLHYRPSWRKIFGKSTKPYPDYYRPKSVSKNHVLHLDWWYAQAHPDEDFAETFAVWLGFPKRWRIQYKGWPVLKKLHYIDELMKELAGKKPIVKSREQTESLSKLKMTLREHYEIRREHFAGELPSYYDRDLRRVFSDNEEHKRNMGAAQFLRKHQKEIRRKVSNWTREYEYTVDQILRDMIERCRDLNLRMSEPEGTVLENSLMMITVQTMNILYGTRYWISI